MGAWWSRDAAEQMGPVGRCKARRRWMKAAVEQRLAMSAAHTAYLVALKKTGAALCHFAQGEIGGGGLFPSPQLPPPPPPPPPPFLGSPSSPSRCSSSSSMTTTWDFHAPFQPDDPPLHLRQLRSQQQPPPLASIISRSPSPRESGQGLELGERGSESPQLQGSGGGGPAGGACEMVSEAENPGDGEGSRAERHVAEEGEEKEPEEGEGDELDDDIGMMRLALCCVQKEATKKKKRDLLEIMKELDEEFLKASMPSTSSGAADVGRLLESTRDLHDDAEDVPPSPPPSRRYSRYGSSARVFHSLSWSYYRSRGGSSSKKLQVDASGEKKSSSSSHSFTLQRLLACEKKLLEEVKLVESLRVQRENKCYLLRHQETRGEDDAEIEKTRAEIKTLHSLIISSSQAVDSTMEAIEDLRDDQLHPQLLSLVQALMHMWETIHECHARQTQIIIHLKSLDVRSSHEPTSETHHVNTKELQKQLWNWHECFQKLVGSQRGYVTALHEWLKLSIQPVLAERSSKTNAADSTGGEGGGLELFRLSEEWHRALSCLPDKVAGEAIKSMAEVVKGMVEKQGEEMKQRRKVEKMEKQWEKKVRALKPLEEEEKEAARSRAWETEEAELEDDLHDDDHGDGKIVQASIMKKQKQGRSWIMMMPIGLMERRADVSSMKKKVEAEMGKQSKAVQDTRVLTMNNLQMGLPGVLEAMAGFSAVFSQSLHHLHSLHANQ